MEFSQDVLGKLKIYQNLLIKWQEKINLVSPNTIENAWERHFLDSAQIEKLLPREAKTLFDLGCGAGFPGLVLAIMNPELDVYLIESDQKKCSFMKAVSRETSIKVHIENTRIENFDTDIVPGIITARALADLPKLFDYCERWIVLNPALTLIFPKGQAADHERNNLQNLWDFECEEAQSVTEPQAKILKFTNVKKR
jgi:16S rRNA (guanine527-N7)-methyltransferase